VEKGKIEDKGKSRTTHDQIICVYSSTIIMIKRVRGRILFVDAKKVLKTRLKRILFPWLTSWASSHDASNVMG